MTGLPNLPFARRHALARHLVQNRPTVPGHVLDQIGAAAAETATRWVPPVMAAAVAEGATVRLVGGDDVEALLLAAMLGCTGCCHLRRSPATVQPVLVELGTRMVLCRKCLGTVRNMPADRLDVCDLCDGRPCAEFVEFTMAVGPLLFSGNAAPCCAGLLEGVAA